MSGIIPYDGLMLGKALYVIERKADFLNGTVDANLIPTVVGQAATAVEQSLTMQNSVASDEYDGAYVGGFETVPFDMRNETGASKDVVIAASLTLNSVMTSTPCQQTLKITDGTNFIKIYSANTNMVSSNTTVKSVIDGVTTTKTLCVNHNFSGNSDKRYCPTLRIDKGRGQVRFFVNDGIYGVADIVGLDKLGTCKFVYDFRAATQNAVTAWVRQVVLRLEC